MYRLFASLALAVSAGPAAACINDVELPAHEREFRSQYHGPVATPLAPSPEPANRPSTGLLVGTGVVLLAGATTLALTNRRAGN